MAARKRNNKVTPAGEANETWWARKDPKEAALALVAWSEDAIQNNLYRACRSYRYASLYEGYTLSNLSSFGADVTNDAIFDGLNVPVIRNKCRRLVLTVINKAFANDNPAPQFVTKGANYEQALAAENIDQAVMAEFDQEQGEFSDIHEMWRHAGTIATSATGRCYIFAFPGESQVECDLDDSLTVGVVKSSQYGQIQTLVRTTFRDPEDLCAKYPDQAESILDATEELCVPIIAGTPVSKDLSGSKYMSRRRQVRVIQGWRCKVGSKDGRRMYVLKDGTILGDSDKPWTKRRPPCVWWDYERELGGEGGTPLTQTIYRMAMRQNEITHDMDRSQVNQPQVTYLVQKGTSDETAIKGQLEGATGVKIVTIAGKIGDAVQVMDNKGLANNSIQLEGIYDAGMHEDTGIARNQTSGQGQTGTTSGIMESLRASYLTENLADQTRRLIRARAVDTARIFVWALQEMIENEDSQFEMWVGDDKFKKQLKASDLDLDESKYVLSIKPVSDEKDSPQTRLQKAEKMLADPTIQFTGADMVQAWATFDVDRTAEELYAIPAWVNEQHKRWLKSSRSDMSKDSFYQSPARWMGLDGLKTALRLTAAKYLWSRQEGADPNRLKFFEKFMDEATVMIQQEERRLAENQGKVQVAPPQQ